MDEKHSQQDQGAGAAGPAPGLGSLLGGLEDLLEEEGVDLGSEDEVKEEDLADLFEEEDEPTDSAAADAPSEATAPARARRDARSSRSDRRNRDLEAFRNLDAQMRLDPMGIEISEDRLTATISRVTLDNTYEETLQLLSSHSITSGIQHEVIRAALAKAGRGQPVYGVVAAKGRAPRISRPAEVVYHLPAELQPGGSSARTGDFERLKQLLEGSHAEAFHSWQGVSRIVREGEAIAELRPAEVEIGEDVFGNPVTMDELAKVELDYGDNTSLSEDGARVVADVFGYAGLLEKQPTVLPPVWLSDDHMEARFVHLPGTQPATAPTREELGRLLEMLWIEYGVMDKQLDLICERLSAGRPLPATLPIAQGSPEVPGENAQIQYAFDFHSVLPWSQLQMVLGLPTPQALGKAIDDLHADPGAPRFTAFRAGEVVVEKIPATEGVPGKDVQGEEVIPEEGQDLEIEVGENLAIAEDHLRVIADCFGYVCLQYDMQVTLLTPLWTSPDGSAACALNLPQTGAAKFPGLEEMHDLLQRARIEHGFSDERWVEHLARLESGELTDALVPVADGTPALEGRDATFEWAVEISDRRPGRVLEDGSIDYRERALTTVVKEGDLIGRLVPPQQGVPGKNVYGKDVSPPPPLNIEVVTDSRIRAEAEDDGSISFYADVGGGVSSDTKVKQAKKSSQKRIHIGIYPISNIEHDVDYSTGNIDFNGDVVIGGSVQPQFSVRATGSVTIGGYVEAGACVTAGKDILVKRGVVGASTELVAGGEVMAKYIQEATVRSGGDVKAGSYIFNASVRAGGSVVVTGKGEGKSRALVGGLIWGAKGVTAKSIGSPYNTSTRLVAGIDPEYVNRADQIRANMQACEEKQRRMMKSIGVDSLDLELLKQKLTRSRDPKDKQAILQCIKRIAKIAELQQNLQKELGAIAETQRQLAFRTQVSVQNAIFAGVELRIGEQTLTLQDDLAKVSFRLVQEGDELDIQHGPFKGSLR